MNPTVENSNLNIFHVGGRNGTIEFPNMPKFNDSLNFFLFDADPESIDKIKKNNKIAKVYPLCLLDIEQNISFNITADPHASSVYQLNEKYKSYYTEHAKYDYLFSEALKAKKKINISSTFIDKIVYENKVPNPDYLSIDAEASEYLILKGANKCLKNMTVAVLIETNFIELQQGQPTFKDIHNLLDEKNFLLADLDISRFHYKRINKKLRGKKMPLGCDALFLKDPKLLYENIIKYKQSNLPLKKLAFISFAYGFNEIGFDALQYLSKFNSSLDDNSLISNFLKECNKFIILNKLNNISWFNYNKFNSLEKIEEKQKEIELKYTNNFVRKFINFKNSPILYLTNVVRHNYRKILNKIAYLKSFLPFTVTFKYMHKTKFQIFLEKNGMFLASKNISNR